MNDLTDEALDPFVLQLSIPQLVMAYVELSSLPFSRGMIRRDCISGQMF